ncbi:unnamed protein product, partial [Prunus brigantina]
MKIVWVPKGTEEGENDISLLYRKGSGPSIKASLQKTKIGEAVVKLQTPVWCQPKALRCLSQLRISGASAGAWHLGRVSSFGRGEGVSALVLVV